MKLKVRDDVCEWQYDEWHDMWETACGQAWCSLEGTLKDNHIKFCPFCGKAIRELATEHLTKEN